MFPGALANPESRAALAAFPLDPHSNRTGQVWHIFVEGLDAGAHYAFRFDMQPNPDPKVYRFNPSDLLLDPYARVLSGGAPWGTFKDGSRPFRLGVVMENHFEWENDQPLNIPLVDSIIYEMHVRSFTRHPSSGSRESRHLRRTDRKDPIPQEAGRHCRRTACRSTNLRKATPIASIPSRASLW